MKIHITNLYNFNKADELVTKQHRFAEAGRELGFTEMGIFEYPVETDSQGELSRRLDGIIAALEPEDVVFMQLPTRNGYEYENRLFNKIKGYRNTKVVFILHSTEQLTNNTEEGVCNKYASMFRQANAIMLPADTPSNIIKHFGLTSILYYEQLQPDMLTGTTPFASLYQTGFYTKKPLMDTIELIFSNDKQLATCTGNENNLIHIGFGLHDKSGNYTIWVGTTMQSIIENTQSKLCFHILHDHTVSQENKNKLIFIADSNGHQIIFHLLNETLFDGITELVKNYTIGTMFRIMLPDLLPELSRIIYLDADLIVNRDIADLWNTNIDNYYLAAVPDMEVLNGVVRPLPVIQNRVPANQYFNAGVLYLNLDLIRAKGSMKDEVLNYLDITKESDFPDQNALNVIYKSKVFLLENTWNYFSVIVHKNKEYQLKKAIYHYAGDTFKLHTRTALDYLYFDILSHTPWGNEKCKYHLNHTLERYEEREKNMRTIFHTLYNRELKKIFYGPEKFAMKNIYGIFSIRENDYRVLLNPTHEENSILECRPLSDLEKENKGESIIFVLPEADNWTSVSNLEKMGFENEKDFFVIPNLLPPELGGYL